MDGGEWRDGVSCTPIHKAEDFVVEVDDVVEEVGESNTENVGTMVLTG